MYKKILITTIAAMTASMASATTIEEAVNKVFRNPDAVKIVSVKDELKQGDLTPVLLSVGGNPQMAFFTGDYLIMGKILPVNNKSRMQMMTIVSSIQADIQKLEMDNRYKTTSEKWKGITDLSNFVEGSGTEIYVFHDPYCHYCEKLYEDTREAVANGKLKIHWISVSIFGEKSIPAAAYMNTHTSTAMVDWHDKNKKGDVANYKPSEKEIAEVKHNTKLFSDAGLSGTPAILYPHDGIVDTLKGYLPAKQLISKLKELKDTK